MKKRDRSYTLKDLLASLSTACAEHGMCPPSMVSIKNWSASGLYKRAYSLQEAVATTVEKMLPNRGAYPLAQSHSAQTTHSGDIDLQRLTRHQAWLNAEIEKRSRMTAVSQRDDEDVPLRRINPYAGDQQAGDTEDVLPGDLIQEVSHVPAVQDLSTVNARLDEIENQMRMLRHDVQGALRHLEHQSLRAQGQESLNPTLAKVIEQLESVRKHVLLRMDNEIQLLRKTAPTAAQAPAQVNRQAQQSDNSLFLSIQKIMSELSRINAKLPSN